MSRRRIAALGFAASIALLGAPQANADHHLVSISEVYPGSAANPNNEFVELQAYAGGQNAFSAYDVELVLYNNATSTVLSMDLPTNPTEGNQRTVLIGAATADTEFGVTSDFTMPGTGFMDPAGGAACFESNVFGNIDCVGWGNVMNIGSLPFGSAAVPAGIPDGQSLQRSKAPGCATLLEPGDDSNQSVSDFAAGAPSPRPSSTPPTEVPCSPGGGGGTAGVVGPLVTPPPATQTAAPAKSCPKGRKLKKGRCVKKKRKKKK